MNERHSTGHGEPTTETNTTMNSEPLPAASLFVSAISANDRYSSQDKHRGPPQTDALVQSNHLIQSLEQSLPRWWASRLVARKPQRSEVIPGHKELGGSHSFAYLTRKTPILPEDLPIGYRILRCLPALDTQGDVVAYEYYVAAFDGDFKTNAKAQTPLPAGADAATKETLKP